MADWITTDEAAELSGYNVAYLRELIRQGKISAKKKGGAYWVERMSLIEYLRAAEKSRSLDKRHGARSKTGS